jgi:tRNA U34 5-methylaminomethyl-2-thiouridine-forming methyltransferase MnmC
MKTELSITQDGSHTLYVPQIDEHYHSVNGAVQESMHIFINAGLKECPKDEIRVLEIGFGTGLNAFLSLLEAEKEHKHILFTTIELYPVDFSVIKTLNYAEQLDPNRVIDFERLHTADWNTKLPITAYFTIEKIQADFTATTLNGLYDVIFFDAFSPEKQPEMWTEKVFSDLYNLSSEGAILTTYCAKGVVRRAMQKAGYWVERLPGPPGKREILRAKKITNQKV